MSSPDVCPELVLDWGPEMHVLVTGATGFVGRTLCGTLTRSGHVVRAAVRADRVVRGAAAETVSVGEIGAATDWRSALRGIDCVIHLAARAHIPHDVSANDHLYAETNGRGTARLVEQAVEAGIRRFIYLSTVKVNGEGTTDRPYAATDEPRPQDAYGKSKLAGELAVLEAGRLALEVAIVRAPLVYGPGVRANFLRLMNWVDRQRPLPLAAVDNKRSMVSLWNLCDLLQNLLTNSGANGRVWMVSDGEDVSTPELIRRIGSAMDRRVRLLPLPVAALQALGVLCGRREEVTRLCSSLVIDLTDTRAGLRWSPPLSMREGLARTVAWYRSAGAPHVG